MAGNPKGTKWYSASQDDRKRKAARFTLSDEARAALDEMAGEDGNKSALVEEAILALRAKRQRKARG